MTTLLKLASPVVRTCTGFHHHLSRFQTGKVRQHLVSLQHATARDFSISIQLCIVEHILCDIQAYRCIILSVHIWAPPIG